MLTPSHELAVLHRCAASNGTSRVKPLARMGKEMLVDSPTVLSLVSVMIAGLLRTNAIMLATGQDARRERLTSIDAPRRLVVEADVGARARQVAASSGTRIHRQESWLSERRRRWQEQQRRPFDGYAAADRS